MRAPTSAYFRTYSSSGRRHFFLIERLDERCAVEVRCLDRPGGRAGHHHALALRRGRLGNERPPGDGADGDEECPADVLQQAWSIHRQHLAWSAGAYHLTSLLRRDCRRWL